MLSPNYPDKHAIGVAQLVFTIVVFIIATLHSPYIGFNNSPFVEVTKDPLRLNVVDSFILGHLFISRWVLREPAYFGLLVYLAIVAYKGIRNIRGIGVVKPE